LVAFGRVDGELGQLVAVFGENGYVAVSDE